MTDKRRYSQHRFPEINGGTPLGGGSADASIAQRPDCNGPDLASIETQAYEDGYSQGCDQALCLEKEKAEPIRDLLRQSTALVEKHRVTIQDLSKQDAVQVAVSLAKHVIAQEVGRGPTATRSLREAVKLAVNHENVHIRLHPDDEQIVKSIIGQVLPNVDYQQKFSFKQDRNILIGGCLVETDFGVVDARIDQQLKSFLTELTRLALSSPPADDISNDAEALFRQLIHRVENTNPVKSCGYVTQVVGLVIEANGPVTQIGCVCDIYGKENEPPVKAEVLGFRDQTVLMMPLEEIRSIGPGSRVVAQEKNATIAVGQQLLGRVIDGLGNPMDGLGALNTEVEYPIYGNPINPLLRKRISKPLDLGVRAINGLLSVGCGQRMGIFAGSGVGKSTLMGTIAQKSQADVNVIALIGERGRELNEFIEKELGESGLKKSVVVVATSDHLPLVRVRGAFVATSIAEFFRDQGLQVNLMMDSLTRFAMAQREIGLALGEPPTTKGYTPSVFTLLPKLLERAGTSDHEGAITGLYTVLVEGDDMNEPIADAARSILDGHIVLTRELADQNHYPAIDILKSVSRVMADITGLQHKHNAGRFKELLAAYRKAEDLINIGAYVVGSNPKIDQAIDKIEMINKYLRQEMHDNVNFEESLVALDTIMQAGNVGDA
jgi:flagellum-specific ATP synthase